MPILHWLDRDTHLKAAEEVPYRLLVAEDAHSGGEFTTSENMLIQGDNLEAVKALLPYYAGKVKCIFIDPPYNTKSAFEHYDDNLEHSQWLGMMVPRLRLLRELLAEDGSIWVTIDDNEAHYLKVVMDEVFGRQNFVANVVWQKKYAPQNDATWLSDSHDHILCYAKHKTIWRPNKLPRTSSANALYKNLDNDSRGLWMSDNMSAKTYSANTDYPITTPSGRIVTPPTSRSWVYSKEKFQELIADGRIWFGKKGDGVPRIKRFLSEVNTGIVTKTIWLREEVGDNQDAKKEVKQFNSIEVFDTPKPEKLMQRILTLATNEGDLVLDSFLGSGTTAAVAHKMKRRYIGIEMGDHALTHCVPRLQKVIEGEQGGISEAVNWQGGGGYRFYRLGAPVFTPDGAIHPDIRFAHLAAHIWFSETRHALHGTADTPLIGVHDDTPYYLLYNGILGDKRPDSGNVLTHKVLAALPPHVGTKVIYGEASRISASRLKELGIIFKQTPYDVKAR